MSNRKKCLDEIKIKMNIKNPKDWGKVTISQIRELGGGSLLTYYGGSTISCLQAVYKG